MGSNLTRRELLASGLAAATTSAMTGPLSMPANLDSAQDAPKRVLRLAHLTDIHVQPEGPAALGMERALVAAQSLPDKPDVIVTGGDQIMDAMGADADRTRAQWKVWQDILKANLTVPAIHVIGNHDVWGWNKNSSKTTGSEPLWGKKWPQEELKLTNPYYSFDRAGWRWIVLDSTFPSGGGYTARLDDAQFEWLGAELAATPKTTPVILVSHQPLFCACAFLDGDNEKSGNWQVPGAWMHIDFRRIKDLFTKHPNVKLSLSGHIHLVDRVDYLDVTYLCNGAVSGGWWGGNYQDFAPGFVTVDLFEDGSFKHEFHTYKWKD